jgi:hypothetical protein
MNKPGFMKPLLVIIFPLFLSIIVGGSVFHKRTALSEKGSEKMEGVNLVAPPRPFAKDPFLPLQQVGADWVAVVPFGYTRPGTERVFYDSPWQWWGERPEGARETIRMAKDAGLKVMLKPQLYVPGSWPGGIVFDENSAWEQWEGDYEEFITTFAYMAAEEEIELLCIGTEFKQSTELRPGYWRNIIQKIRNIYPGKLTYAANWDEYAHIDFWDGLDYIGIDAYFPLTDSPSPEVPELLKAWKPWKNKMASLHQKTGKPILFTEFGYLSVDGCAHKTWELEAQVHQLKKNERAQANALHALLQSFYPEPYWKGGFLWKWFPNMQGHEGYPEKDYTPQGKIAWSVLKSWYHGEKR